MCDLCCLELLNRQLYPRGSKKNSVHQKIWSKCDLLNIANSNLLHFCIYIQTCNIDVNGEVSKIQQLEPYLVVTAPGDENSQFKICCEQDIYVEPNSVKDALIDLMATYYTYNISYPKYLNSIYIFLQHYVFKIIDDQAVPPATMKLVGNLRKVNDSWWQTLPDLYT